MLLILANGFMIMKVVICIWWNKNGAGDFHAAVVAMKNIIKAKPGIIVNAENAVTAKA